MFRFDIEPLHQFAHVNAAIKRPRELTSFSFDDDHKFRLDESSLRYYYPPNLSEPIDLNRGFDTFKQLDDSQDDHLCGLLDAVAALEREKGSKLEIDLLTWRGMMTKIMTTPYSRFDGWEMNVTLFQGTLFIEENHTSKMASRERQHTSGATMGNMSQDLMSYWGYKFESICLLPAPWPEVTRDFIESREEHVVSNYAQYCCIVRTGFGKNKIVIGGEIDAVMAFRPKDKSIPTAWVELKTTAEVVNDKDQVKLERKLLKFWAQSFLLGVPKIVVGYRTQQGLLRRIEEIDTQAIPDKVLRLGKRLWDGQICINFAAAFLEWLKDTVTSDGVWRIRKREKFPVLELFKVQETGTGEILSQDFLDWRLNQLPKRAASANLTSPNATMNRDHESIPAEAPTQSMAPHPQPSPQDPIDATIILNGDEPGTEKFQINVTTDLTDSRPP